jgi:hypothetical protein
MKPIEEMTDEEKYEAIHSARYILEEFYEDGKRGVSRLAEKLTYIPGVVHSALEHLFCTKIENEKYEGGD